MTLAVIVLGSAGSIGQSALDVIRRHPSRLRVSGLATRSNAESLFRDAREFFPKAVAIEDPKAAVILEDKLKNCPATKDIILLSGEAAAATLAKTCTADIAVCAISGIAGLDSAFACVQSGKHIALANKETLVCAGEFFMEAVKRAGVKLFPIDSEHWALASCLAGRSIESIRRVVLTASGGPFFQWNKGDIQNAKKDAALHHPTWKMGPHISIASATLANKAMEIIEAHYLFGIPYDRIEAVIHPQSLVHAWIELNDGSCLMQAAPTDMRLPLQSALLDGYDAEKIPLSVPLSLEQRNGLTFHTIDDDVFPLFRFGVDAGKKGSLWAAAFCGANEGATKRFLETDETIAQLTENVIHATYQTVNEVHYVPANADQCKVIAKRALVLAKSF